VQFVRENPFEVLRHLNVRQYLETGHLPSKLDVLRALLKTESLDSHSREVVRAAIEASISHERLEDTMDPYLRLRLEDLKRKLGGARSPADMIRILKKQEAVPQSLEHLRAFNDGVDLAIRIIRDGRGRIY